MGNKWSEKPLETIELGSNMGRYIVPEDGSVNYVSSLGRFIEIQRRTLPRYHDGHLKFDTEGIPEQTLQIELLPPANEVKMENIGIAETVHAKMEQAREGLLQLLSLDEPRQIIEITHGRYWGHTPMNELKRILQSTELTIERERDHSRNRIWNQYLLIANPKLSYIPKNRPWYHNLWRRAY